MHVVHLDMPINYLLISIHTSFPFPFDVKFLENNVIINTPGFDVVGIFTYTLRAMHGTLLHRINRQKILIIGMEILRKHLDIGQNYTPI